MEIAFPLLLPSIPVCPFLHLSLSTSARELLSDGKYYLLLHLHSAPTLHATDSLAPWRNMSVPTPRHVPCAISHPVKCWADLFATMRSTRVNGNQCAEGKQSLQRRKRASMYTGSHPSTRYVWAVDKGKPGYIMRTRAWRHTVLR